LLNQKPRTFLGGERETVARSKRTKHRKQPEEAMMPNLSGVSFKDALKALLKTPTLKPKKKP
jgi:hypothetical protein